jgi:hypothetical protein
LSLINQSVLLNILLLTPVGSQVILALCEAEC